MTELFDSTDETLEMIIDYAMNMYIEKYIKKLHPPKYVHVLYTSILTRCHAWHCADKTKNKIHRDKVRELVYSLGANDLRRIISDWMSTPRE